MWLELQMPQTVIEHVEVQKIPDCFFRQTSHETLIERNALVLHRNTIQIMSDSIQAVAREKSVVRD